MAADNLDVVDIITVAPNGSVVLTVSDHLDWIDSVAHQSMLQAKINRYLAFVESGEIFTSYPAARGRPVLIRVVTKFAPDADGRLFFEKVALAIAPAGLEFVWTHSPMSAN
jgi:hypothetical protein